MRLIDADELIAILDEESQKKGSLSRILFINFAKDILNAAPTVEVEPTEEQVKEYCRKRCLVILTSEFFYEMKAKYGR